MRITFILPGRGLFGGVRVVVIHGNKLIEHGHQVTIVYFRRSWPLHPKRLLIRVRQGLSDWMARDSDHFATFRGPTVAASVENLSAAVPDGDVIFATHWLTAQPVLDLPSTKGRKYYFLQSYEAHSFDPEQVDASWRLPMPKLVVSQWLQKLAIDKFGDATAVWVPNGVDPRQFDAPPRGLHSPRTVGFVYSPAAVKNADMALDAIRRVRERIPDLRLVSFGASRPHREHRVPLNGNFVHRPVQDRIRDIYASADVWLCSSRVEGFGLPLLEAMACRCPVVATRCGGVSDFVRPGENGCLVDVGDSAAMADATVELLSDPNRWDCASRAAYATGEEFNWQRSATVLEGAIGLGEGG